MLTRRMYFLLSLTWGLPLTIIGALGALVLLILGYKPKKWLYGYYFEVAKSWGGLEAGIFFFCQEKPSVSLRNHEFGHSIQNCYFGPLFIPLIWIPSATRYWYREWLVKRKNKSYSDLPPYDSIWFEGQATAIGDKYCQFLQ